MADEPLRLSKKAQARQERDAVKARKHEERKVRLKAEPLGQQVPRVGAAEPLPSRVPRVSENPDAYLDEAMTYVRETGDCEGRWSWGLVRDRLNQEWDQVIARGLDAHAGQTWRHITNLVTRTGRKRSPRKLNHYQEISTIASEAQCRWVHLELKQHPTAFRFRLGSKRRLWGYRLGTAFHVIWWDPEHDIYKVDP